MTATQHEDLVDIANWQVPPHNRWAFHNIDRILPTAPVASDPARASPLPVSADPLSEEVLPSSVLEATSTDAIVVLIDGEIVYERYGNGNAAHTPHILMSATKAVIGLLVGALQASGRLHSEEPVATYVPEIASTAYAGATLRNLMDMRAGVRLQGEALAAYEAATNWEPEDPGRPGADYRSFFAHLQTPARPHGGPFSYVSANTDLLGWAIERATGETIASLLSTHLWKAMGAEDAAYITLDRNGLARCAGGLCATARDFARLGQAVLDAGRRTGAEIVPREWVEDICEGGDANAWATGEWGGAFSAISKNMRYRSGWYAIDDPPKTLFAMGVFGQNLFIDRTRRIVVAKLSSWTQRIENQSLWLTHEAFGRLQRSLAAGRTGD